MSYDRGKSRDGDDIGRFRMSRRDSQSNAEIGLLPGIEERRESVIIVESQDIL